MLSASFQTEGVRRLIALYCQLLDDQRDAEWLSLFRDDAVWVLGTREFRGRSAIRAYIENLRRERPAWRSKHLCTNVVLELNGSTARVTSDLAMLSRTGDEPWRVASLGRYVDQVVQASNAGAWQFAERRLEIL